MVYDHISAKIIPPNVMKLDKYSLNGETMFPNVLVRHYFFRCVMKLALQITSVIQMSIVVDGWGKCTRGAIQNTTPVF